MNIKPEEITSIIKKEIQRYGAQIQTIDSGTIIQIGDGIARVYGLDDCLSYSGIGGKRSSGLGSFNLNFASLPDNLLHRFESV